MIVIPCCCAFRASLNRTASVFSATDQVLSPGRRWSPVGGPVQLGVKVLDELINGDLELVESAVDGAVAAVLGAGGVGDPAGKTILAAGHQPGKFSIAIVRTSDDFTARDC